MNRFWQQSRALPLVAALLAVWLGGRGTFVGHVERIEVDESTCHVGPSPDAAAAHPSAPLHLEPSRAAEHDPYCAACEQERRGLGCRPVASWTPAGAVRLAERPLFLAERAPSAQVPSRPGRAPPFS